MQNRIQCLLFVSLMFVLAVSCKKQRGMEKVIVEGTVTYAGKEVANGDIKFYPVPGTPGPVSGAPIKDGHYVVKNKDGVPVGEHTVQIRAFAATGGADDDLIAAAKNTARKSKRGQYLPQKYNTRSELTAKVSKDNRTIDFELAE